MLVLKRVVYLANYISFNQVDSEIRDIIKQRSCDLEKPKSQLYEITAKIGTI